MAYCDITKVQARNPIRDLYSQTTKPSASQVYVFINECAGIIDTVLAEANYATPISTTAASSVLATLEYVNAVGAAYMVEWAAPVSDRRKEYEDMWESALKMLETVEFAGLARDSDTSRPRGSIASPPFFTRDMVI